MNIGLIFLILVLKNVINLAGITFVIENKDYAPFYIDKGKRTGYIAINPMKYQDQRAKAWTISTVEGEYQVELQTYLEYDGESEYEIFINQNSLGRKNNPSISGKSEENPILLNFGKAVLAKGDTVKVLARCHSNGKIAESGAPGGYGWSRARWKHVRLTQTL